jgi:predicted nucleotide-binding protein (sugar kinase/HSP70/actin superfamily)
MDLFKLLTEKSKDSMRDKLIVQYKKNNKEIICALSALDTYTVEILIIYVLGQFSNKRGIRLIAR